MKRFFDEELEDLKSHLILMGQKAVEQVGLAMRAFIENDTDLARQVRRNDDELDELEVRIDAEVIEFISLRSPVTRQLRMVIVGMKAAHDLERVGDEANSIAKRTIKLAAEAPLKAHPQIPRLAEMAGRMLRDALDSLLAPDEAMAAEVCRRDKEVDVVYKQVHRELSASLKENPAAAGSTVELLFISKSLERIADHATNIAEEVIYLLRGQDVRHDSKFKKGAAPVE